MALRQKVALPLSLHERIFELRDLSTTQGPTTDSSDYAAFDTGVEASFDSTNWPPFITTSSLE